MSQSPKTDFLVSRPVCGQPETYTDGQTQKEILVTAVKNSCSCILANMPDNQNTLNSNGLDALHGKLVFGNHVSPANHVMLWALLNSLECTFLLVLGTVGCISTVIA